VNVWTVNDDDEIRRLAAAGVDGIVTDVPDVARRALERA
jgi:glycerophosphoryl diester phosphodiesterase